MELPDERNRHQHDNKICSEVGCREYGEHIQSIRTLREEKSDRCPVPRPVYSALEESRKKERDRPSYDDPHHDVGEDTKASNRAENPLQEEQDGQFNEAEGDFFRSLESVFVLFH